jgi:hypothetical protein
MVDACVFRADACVFKADAYAFMVNACVFTTETQAKVNFFNINEQKVGGY